MVVHVVVEAGEETAVGAEAVAEAAEEAVEVVEEAEDVEAGMCTMM
jgi:hypothetical protein